MYKWWLWCFRYRQRQILRRKRTLLGTDAIPRTTEDRRLFQKILTHSARHTIIKTVGDGETGKSRMVWGHWVADICNWSELWMNFELETDKTVVINMRCAIIFEFSSSRALNCWQTKGLKNKHNSYLGASWRFVLAERELDVWAI